MTVMKMEQAAPLGDIFVTATGDVNVIDRHHFALMRDGAILANSGHFDIEIDLEALGAMAADRGGRRMARAMVEEFLVDDRRILVVAEGRLVNLGAAEGHPAAVMDMSFANQALCAEWVLAQKGNLEPKVYDVPRDIDKEIARLKLETMGVEIDVLTPEQVEYLSSWTVGT